ncbi:TIGR02302 family protein [Dongia sp.]|uniref:TIGR02302 family protein n=1 Tax=Dongia sp. TaxID=1977262 RepID=UPI0037534298
MAEGQRRSVLEQNRKAAAAPRGGDGLPLRIRAYVSAAWLWLFLERLLPALLPAFLVAGTCVALALFGVPRLLPAWPQLILLILCGLGFLASLWYGFRGFRLPQGGEAVRRVETDSGFTHRPITHLTDAQASNLIDADSISLWKSYRRRLIASIGVPFLGLPRGTVAAKDPYGLRAVVLLALVISIFVAGDSWQKRLIQAVHPNFSAFTQSETSKVEAWLTPPEFTRLAPISLSSAVQLESGEATPLTVPAGSKLLAQAEGIGAKATLLANGESKDFEMLDAITQRIEGKIQSGDEIAIEADGDTLARWPIKVVPDQAPSIAFATDPSATDRGVLRLDYTAKDDYGIKSVKAVVQLAKEGTNKESLELNLPIPQLDAKELKAYSYQDLTAHPWSGLEVEIRLVARDAQGQIGASAPVVITLPERKFYHPVARAIIEQRKKLARDPDSKDAVAEALRGLNAQPEAYDGNVAVFLSLNLAWRRLSGDALSKDELANLEEQLWDTALALEDGGVSLAMRELREMQRRLEEALNNGASQEEIERLMNQVQEAMNKYLENMRQQLQEAMKNGMQMQRLSPNGLKLSQQDLNKMLNDARRMAQSGSRESAKQMLDRLQQMLENLQAGIPMPMDQQGSQAQKMMNDLMRMQQQQDKLLQDSFRMQRGQQQGEGQQMNGQPQAGEQEGLRQDFGKLMRDFGNMMGDMPQSMGQAEQSMRRAVDALKKGDFEGAGEAQNQALSQMQQSMQQMQQQMQAGMNRGPGQRDPMDPFGRTTPKEDSAGGNSVNTTGVKVPDQSEMERARQIFEELRLRRNDPQRPRDERDYLDRLLKQF